MRASQVWCGSDAPGTADESLRSIARTVNHVQQTIPSRCAGCSKNKNTCTILQAVLTAPYSDSLLTALLSLQVRGCRVKNGDDCITIKSGSSNVLVEDLYCEHGDGLTIGTL